MAIIEPWLATLIITQTTLIPILGLILVGIRKENIRLTRKRQQLLKTYMMYSRGRRGRK